jgi:hypothetical protein
VSEAMKLARKRRQVPVDRCRHEPASDRYCINADATLRHPLESAITIGELIELITG